MTTTSDEFEIRRATRADLDSLVPLFDSYRQFYRKTSDVEGARHFLLDRLDNHQSVVFLAFSAGTPIGFTQLYPSFSSGAMARIYILNDLFVARESRSRGVGSALLETAAEFARSDGAIRMVLSTENSNTTAQQVYERLGWKRDSVFFVYNLAL